MEDTGLIFLDDYIQKDGAQIIEKDIPGFQNWQEAKRFTSHRNRERFYNWKERFWFSWTTIIMSVCVGLRSFLFTLHQYSYFILVPITLAKATLFLPGRWLSRSQICPRSKDQEAVGGSLACLPAMPATFWWLQPKVSSLHPTCDPCTWFKGRKGFSHQTAPHSF